LAKLVGGKGTGALRGASYFPFFRLESLCKRKGRLGRGDSRLKIKKKKKFPLGKEGGEDQPIQLVKASLLSRNQKVSQSSGEESPNLGVQKGKTSSQRQGEKTFQISRVLRKSRGRPREEQRKSGAEPRRESWFHPKKARNPSKH